MSGWTVKKLFAAPQKHGRSQLELKDWLAMLELMLWLIAHTASSAGGAASARSPGLRFLIYDRFSHCLHISAV